MSYEYEQLRREIYDFGEEGEACFVPVCVQCARFVRADKSITMRQCFTDEPNADCSRCGRTQMLFEGFF